MEQDIKRKILPLRVKLLFALFIIFGLIFSSFIIILITKENIDFEVLIPSTIILVGYFGAIIYIWFNIFSKYEFNWISEQSRINTKDFNQMNELSLSLDYYKNEIKRQTQENTHCFNNKNSKDAFQDLECQQVKERIKILSERKAQIINNYDNFLLDKNSIDKKNLMEKLFSLKTKKEQLLRKQLNEFNNSKEWINLEFLDNEIFKNELIKIAKGELGNNRIINSKLVYFVNPQLNKLVIILGIEDYDDFYIKWDKKINKKQELDKYYFVVEDSYFSSFIIKDEKVVSNFKEVFYYQDSQFISSKNKKFWSLIQKQDQDNLSEIETINDNYTSLVKKFENLGKEIYEYLILISFFKKEKLYKEIIGKNINTNWIKEQIRNKDNSINIDFTEDEKVVFEYLIYISREWNPEFKSILEKYKSFDLNEPVDTRILNFKQRYASDLIMQDFNLIERTYHFYLEEGGVINQYTFKVDKSMEREKFAEVILSIGEEMLIKESESHEIALAHAN